jgi:hypothetical protein
MLHKTGNTKYILYSIMITALFIICSCSNSLYSAYSGRSKKGIPKCEAKTNTVNALFIYKR